MTFQPILPLGGYGGWSFLSRTLTRQQAAFAQSPDITRAERYFRDNITKAKTPEALVKDHRLLTVALTAFGLQEDINAKAFIQKVLAGGTLKNDAFANKLSDKRYAQLAFTFGYGNLGERVTTRGFADEILNKFKTKSFEAAVGAQNDDLRMVLNFDSAMATITADTQSDKAQWFMMMGDTPLRKMFETALGLPSSFGTLDIDRQLGEFKARSRATFGTDTLADLAAPEAREKLIRLFLLRSEMAAMGSGFSTGQTALALLQKING